MHHSLPEVLAPFPQYALNTYRFLPTPSTYNAPERKELKTLSIAGATWPEIGSLVTVVGITNIYRTITVLSFWTICIFLSFPTAGPACSQPNTTRPPLKLLAFQLPLFAAARFVYDQDILVFPESRHKARTPHSPKAAMPSSLLIATPYSPSRYLLPTPKSTRYQVSHIGIHDPGMRFGLVKRPVHHSALSLLRSVRLKNLSRGKALKQSEAAKRSERVFNLELW